MPGHAPMRVIGRAKWESSLHWNLTVLDADVDYQEIVSSQDNASSIRSSRGNCFHGKAEPLEREDLSDAPAGPALR
jgi:hypothetical protein